MGVAGTRVNPQERLFGGTMLVLAAEALAFPAGLIVTILLTRYLSPADYGALALALTAVAWLEWTVVTLFARAAWKLLAEANDWQIVAKPVVRVFLGSGLIVGMAVFAAAGVTARALNIPQLAPLLRVLSLEIPIFVTAHAYRSILIGRGLHGSRAAVSAGRWIVRAILIATGTLLGMALISIAVLIVLATAVELAIAHSRTRVLRRADAPVIPANTAQVTAAQLLAYAAPIAVSAICLRLLDRMDIFALRVFGGALETVAAYGVAQNLALGPGLFGTAFVPALVAAYSYRAARGDLIGTRSLSSDALRVGFLMLGLTVLAAGAAPGLIDLLFGARYAGAAPLFAVLIVGAGATLLNAVALAVLIGAGKLRWTVLLTAPLLLLAGSAHTLVVPRYGALGAAVVTSTAALIGGAASCAATRFLVNTPIPFATLYRAVILGAAAAWGLARLHLGGAGILPAGAIASILFAAALVLSGELRPGERARIRALRRPKESAPVP